MSKSNRQNVQPADLCPTCQQPKPNQAKGRKSTSTPKAESSLDPVVKTEPTDEERNGTKLTINGTSFTIRARCFNVDLKFGSIQADSNGQPVRLDLLERDSHSKWAFRLTGANRGVDVLIWEDDLDDVRLAASADQEIMSLIMVPVAKYAKKLSEELAGPDEDAIDLRSPMEGAGKILVDISRSHMDLKKTFQTQFNGHFNKPARTKEAGLTPMPAAEFSKKFSCDYLGTGTFLKQDLVFLMSKHTMEISTPRSQRKDTGICSLHVTFAPSRFTSFQLDPTSRVLTLTAGAEFVTSLSGYVARVFGPGLEVSKEAPVSALRVWLRSGQNIEEIAEFLMGFDYKVQYVPGNFLDKTFPELKKTNSDLAISNAGKRASLPGLSQRPTKKK